MDEDPDIDIEENSFIYPRIESIYSDVNIKTEPIDIDEDDYESVNIAESSSDYYIPIPNKIILGTKPSSQVQSEPIPGPSTAPDTWKDHENYFECDECNLLFPTLNELDSHKSVSHSFLVARPLSRAIKRERESSVRPTSSHSFYEDTSSQDEQVVRRQKAVKSTSKSALNNTFPMLHRALKNKINSPYLDQTPEKLKVKPIDESDRLLCKHCDVRFPNEIALIKHTYELLPENKFQCDICNMLFSSNSALTGHRLTHFQKTRKCAPSDFNGKLLQCNYCSLYLMYPAPMKRHLVKNHKVTEFVSKYTKFTGKCGICSKVMSNYKQSNKHVLKCHQKEFLSKKQICLDSVQLKYKCTLCGHILCSRASAYSHKYRKHPGSTQKTICVPLNPQMGKSTQLVKPSHQEKSSQLLKVPTIIKLKSQKPKVFLGENNFIPRQTLFKCYKCQIHFVKCTAASAHAKRCTLAKGDWKCNKCRRTFTNNEKDSHTLQHRFSEKFKVCVVSEKILSKLLCKCPNCKLHFDEVTFRNHGAAYCIPKSGVECDICNLEIHSDCMPRHKFKHVKFNFTRDDFIVVPFVNSLQNESLKRNKIKVEYGPNSKQILLYCTNCKCHSYSLIKQNYHLEGSCKLLSRRNCDICGLVFSLKPFRTHMKIDHELNNLKLDDFRFRMVQDSKVINPVMPDFYKCLQCDVRFISLNLRNNHKCSDHLFVKCSQCSQKYESKTYNIHLAFHNYGRPKTDLNNSSLKFYSCVACNYGFHSYDSVVEHCQKHYTNTEALITQPCQMCELDYAEDHENLHSDGVIFEIYKFDYEKLLTLKWMDGFDSLSKDVVGDILSRSIYGVLRDVKLELLMDGPAERTLYRCDKCKLHFDEESVVQHAAEKCSNNPRFRCGSCSASFKTRDAKNIHANIHVVYGDDITFREIVFNKDNDKELNDALKTGRPKESLKFRKCQHCELLIKKSEYQSHIAAHDNKFDVHFLSYQRGGQVFTFQLFKPISSAKKPYTVYKCRACDACILQKYNVCRHNCTSSQSYKKCVKCSLSFLPWLYPRHVSQHASDPTYILKNIAVIEFARTSNNNVIKRRRRYSSDDDASTSSRLNISVTKTYETRKVVGKPYSDNLSEDSQGNDDEEDSSIDTSATPNTYAKKYIKKACIDKVGFESNEDSQDTHRNSIVAKKEPVMNFDVQDWKTDMRNKLYQCDKCYLFFVNRNILIGHIMNCNNSHLSETPLICNRCDIVFHPSLITFHAKLHELVNQNPVENYIYLITVSTNGLNTHIKERWLYTCKVCDIYFLNPRSLEMHFSRNHNRVQERLKCEICDLKFSRISRTKHMKIQHGFHNLSKDDLHIEITEKMTVNLGKIHLTAYNKPHTLDKLGNVEIEEMDGDDSQITESDKETEVSTAEVVNTFDKMSNFEISGICDDTSQLSESNKETDTPKAGKVVKLPIDHNLFKCPKCDKYYIKEYTLHRHIKNRSHKAPSVACDICGLLFSTRSIEAHIRVQHKQLNLSRKDFVINYTDGTVTNSNGEDLDESCLYNFDQSQVSETAGDIENSENTFDCKDNNDSVSDDAVILKEPKTIAYNGNGDSSLNNFVESEISEVSDNVNHHSESVDGSEDNNDSVPDKYKVISKELTEPVYNGNPIDHHIYKCVECSVFYTNRRTLLLHIVLEKHKNSKYIKCDKCGLVFDNVSLKSHESVQHGKLKLSRNDFIINDVFGSRIIDDKCNTDPPSIGTGDCQSLEPEDKEDCKSIEVVKEDKIFRLHQCMHCRICVEKSEMNRHICCSDIQKVQCISCCLLFRNTDVQHHRRLHLKHRELSRKSFRLIRFGHRTSKDNRIYKCETCSTHFVNVNSLEWHMDAWKHQTKKACCTKCGLFFGKTCLARHVFIHHKKLKLAVEEFKIVTVSDANKNSEEEKNTKADTDNLANSNAVTGSDQNFTPNANIVRKLFKCVECDVYFLNRASYYGHIYKHRKLDATEYIDCNMCDLQFLNESLGVHMKSHKDKSFCLDKLLIEAYQPNSAESLRIKTYLTQESLDSKLVSTTTLFDNDDESVLKDDQLSEIDSTSDEVPKLKPKAGSIKDNIITPSNTDSNTEEEILNQNAEVPEIDGGGKVAE